MRPHSRRSNATPLSTAFPINLRHLKSTPSAAMRGPNQLAPDLASLPLPANINFWRSGRRLSAASLYRYIDPFKSSAGVVRVPRGGSHSVRLVALTQGRFGDPVIAVVSTSAGEVTFEYRINFQDDLGHPSGTSTRAPQHRAPASPAKGPRGQPSRVRSSRPGNDRVESGHQRGRRSRSGDSRWRGREYGHHCHHVAMKRRTRIMNKPHRDGGAPAPSRGCRAPGFITDLAK